MNLLQLRTAVLSYINRPASEMSTDVDREINLVLLQLQRLHEFKYCERLVKIVYPANTLQLELTGACEGSPRNFISIQLLTDSAANNGAPLYIKQYNALQQARFKYQRLHTDTNATHNFSYEERVGFVDTYEAFLVSSALGLNPTPTVDVNLLLNLYVWLPNLEDDTDENFFTQLAGDLVIDMTVDRMNYFLKEDERIEISAAKIASSFEALRQWDSQIRLVTDV